MGSLQYFQDSELLEWIEVQYFQDPRFLEALRSNYMEQFDEIDRIEVKLLDFFWLIIKDGG